VSRQFVLDLAQPEPPTFDSFVVGANAEAVSAVRALARGEMRDNGILIWGAGGAGKTHLLRAAAAAASSSRAVVECVSTTDVRDVDVETAGNQLLIVDDIDEADAIAQARLFTWLNVLAARGGQWMAASSAPPARIALRDDLRTRVALGLVYEIVALEDRDKARALETYAHDRGFHLSREVIDYLLAHAPRDMPSLVALLAALDRHSLATRRSVTIPLVREWMELSPPGDGRG
jgi:DnaA family protein